MPFRLFHVYDAWAEVEDAKARISATIAHRYGAGGSRRDNGDYTEEFRADMELARLLPPRGR